MRRVIFSMITLSMAVGSAALSAQTPVPGAHQHRARGFMPGHATGVLMHRDELGLSAQQVSRIEEIQAQLEAQNRPLVEQLRSTVGDSLLPRAGLRGDPEMRERMRERASQMTPEQRAEMRERMRELRARASQLTPDERAELRSRLEERRAEAGVEGRRPPRERLGRLSEEQRAAIRPVIEQLRENHAQAVRAVQEVLTPEQQASLRELRKQRRAPERPRGGERRGFSRRS